MVLHRALPFRSSIAGADDDEEGEIQVYAGVKAKFALQALREQATGICLAAYEAMS
jgi:hypothetical protein